MEHMRITSGPEPREWEVADVTTGGDGRPREDLVWIELYGSGEQAGRWMTPVEAEAFAAAILDVAAKHRERLKLSRLDSEQSSHLPT